MSILLFKSRQDITYIIHDTFLRQGNIASLSKHNVSNVAEHLLLYLTYTLRVVYPTSFGWLLANTIIKPYEPSDMKHSGLIIFC